MPGYPKTQELICPYCKVAGICDVVDSRETKDGCCVKRKRLCRNCHRRFKTVEHYYPDVGFGCQARVNAKPKKEY